MAYRSRVRIITLSICTCISVMHFTMMHFTKVSAADEVVLSNGESKHVFVAVSNTELRSGPSKEYYPTAIVPQATSLEVHHRTDDGWLGVRPPEGSFSWVPAKDAYLLPGGRVIEIINESAVSWIGTQLGTAKQYRWQVQLVAGEQIAVLAEAEMPSGKSGKDLWYKIAPPSGEFRWIHETAISTHPVEKPTIDTQGSNAIGPSVEPAKLPNREPKKLVVQSPKNAPTLAPAQMSAQVSVAAAREDATNRRLVKGKPILDEDGAVQQAAFEDDVFAEGPVVLQDAGQATHLEHDVRSGDRWAGWHAMELGENGLRFTWLESILGGASQPRHDPLNHDPFDLSMSNSPQPAARPGPPRHVSPQGRSSIQQRVPQDRPWRDPRTLRSNRIGGYSSNATAPNQSSRDLVASIREGVAAIGESIRPARQTPAGTGEQPSADRRSKNVDRPSQFDKTASHSQVNSQVNWYGVDRRSGSGQAESANSGGETASNAISGSPETIGTELDRLQVALGEVVAQPPGMWDLQPIVQKTKYFIEHGQDPIQRGKARLLLERIDEFQQHARRTAFGTSGSAIQASFTGQTDGQFSPPIGPVTTASFTQAASDNEALTGKSPFDATGWLVPVHSAVAGQPSHALSDDNGQIIAYVTALPGMKLDGYINLPVGITGLRGYLPKLQAGHIQAQRIVQLGR